MIVKSIERVEWQDIEDLVANSVQESRYIEYKANLPDFSNDSKKEFLADASSFANADGGHIIYGIKAVEGTPTNITGISTTSIDADVLRLENLLRDGISPRIEALVRPLSDSSRTVLVVHIRRSWDKPHRVIFSGNDKFYSRNSAGKYPLDVQQLRQAFAESSTTAREIETFIRQRNVDLLEGNGFLELGKTGKLALYLIPIRPFAERANLNVYSFPTAELPPLSSQGWDDFINLEGYLTYWSSGSRQPVFSYTELYRNGTIEAVSSAVFMAWKQEERKIWSHTYEETILNAFPQYAKLYSKLGVDPPIAVSFSMIDIKGYPFGTDPAKHGIAKSQPFTKDILALPIEIVSDFSVEPAKAFRPLFDLVWNAFGFRRSMNYDNQGTWK